jgi:MerR family transcriptional regulator, light-induced transcriptional regulator
VQALRRNMGALYDEFVSYLDTEDRDKCVQFALSNLQNGNLSILALYSQILTPAMHADFCGASDRDICIWKEHVRTSIVRTVIECSYPYVAKEGRERAKTVGGRVLVACPPGELHELGARMVADFFVLCGFEAEFAGANTPADDLVSAVRSMNPVYVALSVTNYYNLIATRQLIGRMKGIMEGRPFRVVLGGQSCQDNPGACLDIGADFVLRTFEDIERLPKEVA